MPRARCRPIPRRAEAECWWPQTDPRLLMRDPAGPLRRAFSFAPVRYGRLEDASNWGIRPLSGIATHVYVAPHPHGFGLIFPAALSASCSLSLVAAVARAAAISV